MSKPSSILNMAKRGAASPQEADAPAMKDAAAQPGPTLKVPLAPPPEIRHPLSTRVKPSLVLVLDGMVGEIKSAGYRCTREYVLEALLLELAQDQGDEKPLRERVAERIVRGEVR